MEGFFFPPNKGCRSKRGGVYVSQMKNVIGAGYTTQKVGTSVGTHGAVALTVAFPTAHTHTHTPSSRYTRTNALTVAKLGA
jgi:hypothetical protein